MRTVINVIALLVGLPLVGVVLAAKPLAVYLEFPPTTRYVAHEPFSWPAFVALALLIVGTVGPFIVRISERRFTSVASRATPFPWWGWVGVAVTAVAWALAWNRFEWFTPLQPYTFTPLWVGYILVVNAWTFSRTGTCMMRDRPRYFLALFPISSAFWWFFEYLNRFVQNWFYAGVGTFSPLEYFLSATIPFSTVLPAVLGTKELVASFDRLNAGLDRCWSVQIQNTNGIGRALLLVAAAGLIGMGIWPNYLFPLVWVAPLLVITALQMIRGEETIFSPLAQGDWRSVWQPALAALVCGFFWELWNYKSLAHWEYAVPFVQRFHLFEMPLLGYAGYLPFGLECVAVVRFFSPHAGRHTSSSASPVD